MRISDEIPLETSKAPKSDDPFKHTLTQHHRCTALFRKQLPNLSHNTGATKHPFPLSSHQLPLGEEKLDLRFVQPMVPDALIASAPRDYVFVVNPSGANGRTGQQWKKMKPDLNSRLGKDCNIHEALTTGPLHAVQIAREAVRDGAAAVVAVGGDGTLHEVLNGFFDDGKVVQSSSETRTALGLIPVGTGSDLARHFGWNLNDKDQAIDRLVKGQRRRIDVGRVQLLDDKVDRYFLNVASLHLSAKAGYFASMYKTLGNLCYVIGALQAFRSHENRDLRIRINGGEWSVVPKVTATCVGNAKYFGGGMNIAPSANPFNGGLEVVSLMDYKWYDFILKMHTLYQGTHVHLDKVTTTSVQTLEVEDVEGSRRGDVFVQADGEHLGFLPAKFSVLPQQLDFIL